MNPALYHSHHSRYTEDLPFWLNLAARHPGPTLELGCGTGRVLYALADAGYKVFGLDKDLDMLAFARSHLEEAQLLGKDVHLFQADMAVFSLGLEFSLVVLPCNTLSTLSGEQQSRTLACVRRHLAKGGVFAASLPNPALLSELSEDIDPDIEDVFIHPSSGNPVQVSSAWHRSGSAVQMLWHYDHLLPDGKVERITASVEHTLASVEVYASEFETAGFTVKTLYGDFERAPYIPDSPYLILLAG